MLTWWNEREKEEEGRATWPMRMESGETPLWGFAENQSKEFLSLICISKSQADNRKEINEKKKPGLTWCQLSFSLSAAIGSVSTGKDTSGTESSVRSSEVNEDCVLQEDGSDTSYHDNTPSQNWFATVGVTMIAMHHWAYFAKLNSSRERGQRFVILSYKKMWFPWITLQPKNPCNFQPSFRGGSVSLVW